MLQKGRKLSKRLLTLALAAFVIISMSGISAVPAKAAAAGSVSVYLVDKAGSDQTLATWTFDSGADTYLDSDGNALSLVKDFTQEANLSGTINGKEYNLTEFGAIPYTGINKKPDPRCLSVTTKGILLEDFYDYSEALASSLLDGEVDLRGNTVFYLSDASGYNDNFTYNQYWGLDRYYYPDWYTAESYSAADMGSTSYYTPTTLAVCGYHNAIVNGSTTVSALKESADSEYALRISSGMQEGGNTSITDSEQTDINEGKLSVQNISVLRFTPVYNKITITDGTESGTAGEDLAYEVNGVTVTADDNYFTAAAGESVTLTATADALTTASLSITDAENNAVEATQEGSSFTFTMPDSAVTVAVSSEENDTITSAEQLAAIADKVNGGDSLSGKTITLGADIDLSGYENWTPIGNESYAFEGTFDGAGYAIKDLNINMSAGYAGLFGNNAGTIKDFTLSGTVTVTGSQDFAGAVAGFNSGTIEGVSSTAQVSAESAYNVGGIAGLSTSGKWVTGSGSNATIEGAVGLITKCAVNATITGYNKVGGIVGENAGTVSLCKTEGTVDGTNASSKNGVGGIAGRNGNNNTAYEVAFIDNCYSVATVGRSGQKWVGGIAGFQDNLSNVTNSYFAGSLTGGSYTNAIVGNQEGKASNNYSLDTISNSGKSEAEIGTQTAEVDMKMPSFVEKINADGGRYLSSCNAYPVLSWEEAVAHTLETTVRYREDGGIERVESCSVCGNEFSEAIEAVTFDSYQMYSYREDAHIGEATTDGCHLVIEATFDGDLTIEDAQKAAASIIGASGISVRGLDPENTVVTVDGNTLTIDNPVTFMPGGILAYDTVLIDGLTCDGKAVYWPQGWKTVAPTGLAFEVTEVVVGTDSTPASTTIQVTSPACVRSMNHILWTSNGSSLLEGAGAAQTSTAHHHNFYSMSKEDSAKVIANNASSALSEIGYTTSSDGDTVTITANEAVKGEYLGIYNYDDNFLQAYGFTLADSVTGLPQPTTVAVQEVMNLIDALGDITLDSDEAIDEIVAAYDALSDTDKAMVGNITTLVKAEAALVKQQAVANKKSEAVIQLTQMSSLLSEGDYTASSWAAYTAATENLKKVLENDAATKDEISAAQAAVTQAYDKLAKKNAQNLTVAAKTADVDYAKTKSAAQTFSLVTASGNQGALTYSLASGSSQYASINAQTGVITLKKGTPAGAQTVNVAVNAAATNDYSAAGKTVTATINVKKAANPVTVKVKKKTVKLSKVKKAKQTVTSLTVKKAAGKVTYKKASGSKKLTVNKKTGKITVAKGTKKGTYKIKVKITAKGDTNYKAKTVTKTIKVKVK